MRSILEAVGIGLALPFLGTLGAIGTILLFIMGVFLVNAFIVKAFSPRIGKALKIEIKGLD